MCDGFGDRRLQDVRQSRWGDLQGRAHDRHAYREGVMGPLADERARLEELRLVECLAPEPELVLMTYILLDYLVVNDL